MNHFPPEICRLSSMTHLYAGQLLFLPLNFLQWIFCNNLSPLLCFFFFSGLIQRTIASSTLEFPAKLELWGPWCVLTWVATSWSEISFFLFSPFSFSFFLMDLCSTSMNRDIPIEFKNLTNLKHLELNENDFKVPPSLLAHLLLLLLLLLFSHPFKHWNPLVRSFPIPFICCRTWKSSPWRRTKSSTWARRWKTGKRWGQGLP